MDILSQIEQQIPLLGEMHLGHTPMQVEFFKTAQQRGSRKFEYWNHLVQMKSLETAIRSLWLDIEEVDLEVWELTSFWNKIFTSRARRVLKNKRLQLKLSGLKSALADKELEISRHLKVVLENFSDLLTLSEEEIMQADAEYWAHRLARQIAYSQISSHMGVPVGEVAAIAALPPALALSVMEQSQQIIATGVLQAKKLGE